MKNNNEIQVIKDLIDSVDIVSFDIFDTLLLRNVIDPTDVFDIVNNMYQKHTGDTINFKKMRIQAEKKARQLSKKEDVTYDEIYTQLEKNLNVNTKLLQQLELEVENKVIICNEKLQKLYQYAIDMKKTIFLITDMYLPKTWIENKLKQLGYSDTYQLYISSEVMKSKATGSIYEYIRIKEKVISNKWLHIGDNYEADYKNAIRQGLQAYYYEAVGKRYQSYKCKTLFESIMRAVQINNLYLNSNRGKYWYNFGRRVAAPLVIEFTLWLEQQLEGKENAYFLARDGYIPLQLYRKLAQRNERLPKGQYLYASRRAYTYPGLLYMDKEEAIDWLMAANKNLGQTISLDKIFGNLGLSVKDYILQIQRLELVPNKEIENELEIRKVKKLLNEIWKDIKEALKKEECLLKEYFKEMELDKQSKIYIIDIGWSGSTHRALQSLISKEVQGYYLGTLEQIYDEIKWNSKGYLFDKGRPNKVKKKVMKSVMLFEFIFSAPEGSVINFRYDKQKVIPYIADVEKNNYMYEIIQEVQKGIEDIFDVVLEYKEYIHLENNVKLGFELIENFVNEQLITDLEAFEKLRGSIGIGNSGDVKKYVYKVDSKEYLHNRNRIEQQAQQLLWKNAVLIEDEHNRIFNLKEYQRLYKIRKIINMSKCKKGIQLVKKGLYNPNKGIKWIKKKILK